MRRPILLLLLFLPACASRAPEPPPPRGPNPHAATSFDATTTGTIRGVVTWRGTIPQVENFRSSTDPLSPNWPPPPARDWANPHAPRIDPTSHALADAVVMLRGVDVRKARPWDHPAVRVELAGQAFRVGSPGTELEFAL